MMSEQVSVLLVDDLPENLLALEAVLDDLGLDLVKATSGEEALRYLLQKNFAAILLDVSMPSMDGFELTEILRQRDNCKDTPIIFVTAISKDDSHVRRGYELGAVDYLFKPVAAEAVRSKVKTLVGLYRKTQRPAVDQSSFELTQAAARLDELYGVSSRMSQFSHSAQILGELLDSSLLRMASSAVVFIFDQPWSNEPTQSGYVEAVWHRNLAESAVSDLANYQLPLPVLNGLSLVHDVERDPRLSQTIQIPTQSLIQVPLVANSNWFGCLVIHWDCPLPVREEDLPFLQTLVRQSASALYSLLQAQGAQEVREQLGQAEEFKSRFLKMISHELRTPLTSIKGFATTLLQAEVEWDSANQREFLHIINQEADNLTNLVEKLLTMTQLEAGTFTVDLQPDQLADVINKAMPRLLGICNYHTLRIEMPDPLPLVTIDGPRIIQLFSHLVSNACRFAPPQTSIDIAARLEGTFIRVDITDQGPGIPMEERELIFRAFYQAQNRVSYLRGVGLGLAIAHAIVERHHGQIWISDTSDAGTTVSFTLPILSPPA